MSDVGSFIVGAVTTAAGIFVTTLSFGLATPLGSALISFGAGQLVKGIFGTPRPSNQEIQSNVGSPDATLPVVYGTQKLGVKIVDSWVNPNSDDRKQLVRAGAICLGSEDGSGIESIKRVWLDDELAIDPVTEGDGSGWLTSGVQTFFTDEVQLAGQKIADSDLGYRAFRGTDAQTVPDVLNSLDSSRWGTNFRNRGVAWLVLDLWKDKEKFPRIPNVTVEVEGQRVYDPRDSTWKFSNNPALCLLDYLTSKRYGAELFYPERDGGDTDLSEIDEQSFIDAANYCEEQVDDGSAGTQDRFAFDGYLDTGNRIRENVDALLSAMRGDLVFQNGRFRLVIRKSKSAAKTLTTDEIIGEWEIRRGGASKVPNRVVARFSGGESGDLTEDVEWPDATDSTFEDQDAGHPHTLRMDLPGVQDVVRAQQIGMVGLREAREDTAARVKCRMSASDLEIGDVVTVDHETPGWTGSATKDFWIVSMELLAEEEVRLTLKEYSADAYDLTDTIARPTPPPGSSLPDRTEKPTPTNLATTSGSATAVDLGDGTTQPRILATWTVPDAPFYDFALLRYRAVADEDGNAVSEKWQTGPTVDSTEDQQAYLDGVKGGYEYEVQIRCRTNFGAATDWTAFPNVTASRTGAVAPIIQIETSENLSLGTVDVTVIDPAGGTTDVEFFERVGAEGYPATPAQTNNDVASGNSVQYSTTLDVDSPTFIRVVATLDINGNQDSEEVTFAPGSEAKIEHLQATIDPTDGTAIASVEGNSDVDKIHLAVGDGSSPTDPDPNSPSTVDATINGRSGTVDTGVAISEGNTAYVKARGEMTDGTLGPVLETTVPYSATGHPIILVDTSENAAGDTGTLTATIIDPDGGNVTFRFYERQGHGDSYGSPVATVTGQPSGSSESHSISLIEGKNSWIKVEAEVEASGRKNDREVSFDPNKTANLDSFSADVDDAGNITIHVGGDSDTGSIDVSIGAPINESTTISARSGSFSPTTKLGPEEKATVTATPKNDDGDPGPSRTLDISRGGSETSDVAPRPTVSRTNETIAGLLSVEFTYRIDAVGGATAQEVGSSPEVKYRVNGPGDQMGTYSGWQTPPIDVVVEADVREAKELEVVARETALSANPESAPVTRSVPSVLAWLTEDGTLDPNVPVSGGDFPGGGRSQGFQNERHAGSGYRPTGRGVEGGAFAAFADGLRPKSGVGNLVSGDGKVQTDLAYQSGQGVDAMEPAEASAEVTQGKDLNVLSGRTADKVDYVGGVSVDSLEPAESGAEVTSGKDLSVLGGRTADKIERAADAATLEDLVQSLDTAGKLPPGSLQSGALPSGVNGPNNEGPARDIVRDDTASEGDTSYSPGTIVVAL